MANMKAHGRAKAIVRIMAMKMKPGEKDEDEDISPADSQVKDESLKTGRPATVPPPEDGSKDQNEANEDEVAEQVSDLADGLEALAEKATPQKKQKLLTIVDQLRECAREESDIETPDEEEKEKDAKLDKPGIGPAAPSMIY